MEINVKKMKLLLFDHDEMIFSEKPVSTNGKTVEVSRHNISQGEPLAFLHVTSNQGESTVKITSLSDER